MTRSLLHKIEGLVTCEPESLDSVVGHMTGLGIAMPPNSSDVLLFAYFVREYKQYSRIAESLSKIPGVRRVEYFPSARLAAEQLQLEALKELSEHPVNEPYED